MASMDESSSESPTGEDVVQEEEEEDVIQQEEEEAEEQEEEQEEEEEQEGPLHKENQVVFKDRVAGTLFCGICTNVLEDPVLSIQCGHTFCKLCVSKSNSCPFDDVEFQAVIPNISLSDQLRDLSVFCPNAVLTLETTSEQWRDATLTRVNGVLKGGCTADLRYDDLSTHLDVCEFEIFPCPNGDLCGMMPRKELETHLREECVNHSCQHMKEGCLFRGTLNQLEIHSQRGNCVMKGKLEDDQTKAVEELASVCDLLEKSISSLSQRMEALEMSCDVGEKSLVELEKLLEARKKVKPTKKQMELVMPFNFRSLGTFRGHRGPVWIIVSDTQRNLMFSGGHEEIKVWDMTKFACVATLEGHKGVVHSLCVTDDRLISCDSLQSLRTWNLNTLQEIKSITVEDSVVCAMVATTDHVYTALYGSIKKLDINELTVVGEARGLGHWVRALGSSDQEDAIYSACHNLVTFWDPDTFQQLKELRTTHGSIHSIATTNSYILCGTQNQGIQVYDVSTHEHLFELPGHIGTVNSLVVSPCGNYLFSASSDTTIKIWNLQNKLLIQTLSWHTESCNTLHIFQGLLLSGGSDEAVRMYKPQNGLAKD